MNEITRIKIELYKALIKKRNRTDSEILIMELLSREPEIQALLSSPI